MAAHPDSRRRSPRAAVRLECTLTRRKGSPLPAHTLDVGPGGMCVRTDRPLSVDELVNFDLGVEGAHAVGMARVLRQHGHDVYALRFEGIGPEAAERIAALSRPA